MKTYTVSGAATVGFEFEVEANSLDEARGLAREYWRGEADLRQDGEIDYIDVFANDDEGDD